MLVGLPRAGGSRVGPPGSGGTARNGYSDRPAPRVSRAGGYVWRVTWRRRLRPGAPGAGRLDRTSALAALRSETFDVVVVGGGITGCGVALDAAARGLRTALVEADDFAAGTSSRSSKLVHGGLRYLQHGDYRLVYEALAERQRLLKNAPHLVRRLPFLIPLFGTKVAAIAKAYSSALWIYDLTGGLRIGCRHHRVTAADALRHMPVLRPEALGAGFVYWDAQVDDARLTLAVARSAAACGAVVVNHSAVNGLVRGPQGRLSGVRLADGTEVRATVVVNAGGVWSGEIAALAAGTGEIGLRPAKGVHVTIPSSRLPCDRAIVLPVPGERRSVFVVPWDASGATPGGSRGRWTYVGTTDTDYEGPLDVPRATAEDVDDLLAAVNAWTTAGLTAVDVSATWAGLRPLVSGEPDAKTADLSRRHRVTVSDAGLVTVTGGKLTTYRKMAADAVDEVVGLLGRRRRPSPTRRLVLVGGEPPPTGARPPAGGPPPARPRGLLGVRSVRDHLVGRYGSEAPAVAAIADESDDLASALVLGLPYLRAEAVFAVRHEMALSVMDVLARRTRCLILDHAATVAAAPAVARLIGSELGWSDEAIGAETAAFLSAAVAGDPVTAGSRAEAALRVAPGSDASAGAAPTPGTTAHPGEVGR